jgi:carbon monoxide dehydrogenase subunit G
MELEHSFTIPVPPEQAWQVLLDVERIAPCMPGATVDSVDGDTISGRIKVKVGPVALTYSGKARFVERDDQGLSVTLEASGKETRGSGTASAKVRSSLRDEGGQTRVVVNTTMSVTGRPAQFGRGVMAEVGGKIIERFAGNLAALLAGGAEQAAGNGSPAGGAAAGDTAGGGTAGGGTARGNGAGPGTEVPGPAQPSGGALPIEELDLPVRAYNSLRREGIHTVADLAARTENDLLAIQNLGPQSVKEIRQKLADRGLALSTAGPGTAGPGAGGVAAAGPSAAGTPSTGPSLASGAAPGAGVAADAAGAASARGGTPGAGPSGAAASGAAAGGAAPRAVRPPDEDAIDLLSVAGFPVLKRALPAAGLLLAFLVAFLRVRRRRRRRAGG